MNKIKKMLFGFLLLLIMNQQAVAQESFFTLQSSGLTNLITLSLVDAFPSSVSYTQANVKILNDHSVQILGQAGDLPIYFSISRGRSFTFQLTGAPQRINSERLKTILLQICLNPGNTACQTLPADWYFPTQ